MRRLSEIARGGLLMSSLVAVQLLGGCSSDPATRNALAGAGVVVAGVLPSTNLEQVYYVGVFDPQDQIPPTLYRVRVRGQASALNFTQYASGWVHADLIDSLSTSVKFTSKELDSGVDVKKASAEGYKAFTPGRRLVMFAEPRALTKLLRTIGLSSPWGQVRKVLQRCRPGSETTTWWPRGDAT